MRFEFEQMDKNWSRYAIWCSDDLDRFNFFQIVSIRCVFVDMMSILSISIDLNLITGKKTDKKYFLGSLGLTFLN